MADTTTRYGFPFQEASDPPDGATLGQDLAEAVETALGGVEDDLTTAQGDITSLGTRVTDLEGDTEGKPIVRLEQQTAQTGNASAATLTLSFGTSSEIVDTGNFHSESVNNSRVTPTKAGWYRIVVKPILAFNANITGAHSAVLKNGTVVERSGNHRPNTTAINSAATPLESWQTANGTTDYFESGVSCTTSAGTWDTNGAAGSRSMFMVEFMRDL